MNMKHDSHEGSAYIYVDGLNWHANWDGGTILISSKETVLSVTYKGSNWLTVVTEFVTVLTRLERINEL